jgi:nicotinate-nucleotide pyrophosphorylase (carboxylating)
MPVPIEPPPAAEIERVVALALAEDRAFDDATSLATVTSNLQGRGAFVARQAGTLAGTPIVEAVFRALDPAIRVETPIRDGESFRVGETVLVAGGPVRGLLQGERVALNFLQRLSATATLTRAFVDAVVGTGVTILDTRKTTPGLRALEKYAVRCGGGVNHRSDLATMAMIKDNHREALARGELSLADGIARIRTSTPGIAIEVEIDDLEDLEAALAGAPEWILLDNMSPVQVRRAVELNASRARLEVSGGVTLETVPDLAEAGPDAISVGALTHSAGALDIGLDLAF